MNKHYPAFTCFSTDSLGKSQFHTSPLFPVDVTKGNKYISKQTGNSIAYYISSEDPTPVWEFRFSEKQIVIRARFHENASAENLFISFSQRANHCTVLGHFSDDGRLRFPNVLHFPNMGSFRMYCSQPGFNLHYNAELTDKPFVNIAFSYPIRVAICYDLPDKEQGKKIMQALLEKMKAVGYTNFALGLPGNLMPVRPEDYTDHNRRWGYGKDEEGRG